MDDPRDYEAAKACQLLLDRLQLGEGGRPLAALARDAAARLEALAARHDPPPTAPAADREIAQRTEALYRQIHLFPEAEFTDARVYLKREAYTAFLDLRQLLEREIIPALYRQGRKG